MIDADALRDCLDASDHRRILQACGFEINGQSGSKLSGILGPKELGEGSAGNFSVDLEEGLVKDWGSSGYEGDVIDVVRDIHGLNFPGALDWIVDELSLDASTLEQEAANGSSSEVTTPDSESRGTAEPVATREQVRRWNERLMGDTGAAQAARSYLIDERGLHPRVVQLARVGLAHEKEIPDDWSGWFEQLWIVFPVPRRDLDGTPIVAVKGVAFDPGARDWKRDSDGDKIPRNVSSALWDLVPTDDDGEPRIDGPVVLCEREIDALCALSQGLNAVTGTAGAGTFKEPWAEYVASLAPAQEYDVVVAFDGDDKGRKGAKNAAQKMHEAGVDVRRASLPDDTDVNDVLVSGGRDALESHLAQAEPYSPPTRNVEPRGDGHAGSLPPVNPEPERQEKDDGPVVEPLLGTEEPPPMKWRVTDFVPEDHLTMLLGDGGTGKSILSLYLALCICIGRSFLGMGVRRGNVLYVDHELDRNEQLRRIHRIARGMGIDAADTALQERLQYWRPKHALGTDAHQEAILEAVETYDSDLVILDSLTMGATGDVTDVSDVVPIMRHIRRWPTTIAIDHVSHDAAKRSAAQARAFGSVFKRNAARSSLTLAQSDTGGYCIQQEKSNFSEGDGRLVYAVDWTVDEITFESISDADERAAGLLSDLSSKNVTLVAVKEEYEALGSAVLAENVVQWRNERDEVSSVQKKTIQNHFSALKRRGDLIGADGEGVLPASAEYEAEEPF